MYSFPDLQPVCCSMFSCNCASWPAYRFLRRQVRWSGIPTSCNFPEFVVVHTIKGFGIVNKADVFLELACFFDDPTDVGYLISGSSAFSKSSLKIWNFRVHILLKPRLENFENYFANMWDECNCAVVPEPQVTSKTSEAPTVYPEMSRESAFKCV